MLLLYQLSAVLSEVFLPSDAAIQRGSKLSVSAAQGCASWCKAAPALSNAQGCSPRCLAAALLPASLFVSSQHKLQQSRLLAQRGPQPSSCESRPFQPLHRSARARCIPIYMHASLHGSRLAWHRHIWACTTCTANTAHVPNPKRTDGRRPENDRRTTPVSPRWQGPSSTCPAT